MVVNFRARGISRSARKLTRIHTLNSSCFNCGPRGHLIFFFVTVVFFSFFLLQRTFKFNYLI